MALLLFERSTVEDIVRHRLGTRCAGTTPREDLATRQYDDRNGSSRVPNDATTVQTGGRGCNCPRERTAALCQSHPSGQRKELRKPLPSAERIAERHILWYQHQHGRSCSFHTTPEGYYKVWDTYEQFRNGHDFFVSSVCPD